MTYSDGDVTVTTWGRDSAGQQTWRGRHGDRTVEFTAPRDADTAWLCAVARALLGLPVTENAADCLVTLDGVPRA